MPGEPCLTSRMEASEAAVVALARTGDDDAFRALVERYSRGIFRLGFRMTGNKHDAEEVVQETFLRAFRGMGQFESRAGFGTWLYRIATNCSLDLIRMRQKHEEQREPSRTRTAESEAQDPTQLLASDAPTPDRLLLSAEVEQRVAFAMGRLTPMEKAAFTLRHYEGLSIEEIGRALGLRNGAAKNNVFRAVRKLREALEPLV